MTIIHGKSYGKPTLDLNFAGNKSLIDTITRTNYITFTRAQSGNEATYVGSDGLIKYASADEPRFDHDPETLESLGLLIEESRTNLETYSEVFTDSSWIKTDSSVLPNNIVSPDGLLNGTKVVENTINAARGVYKNYSGTLTSGVTYTHSVFAKAAERTTLQLSSSQGLDYANFNLSTGTITYATSGSNASIVALSNGWYRCSASFTPSNVALVRPYVLFYDTDNPSRLSFYTGDGTSGIYIWGAQLEAGSFPTSYIPTSGSTVTRGTDLVSILGSNYTSIFGTTLGSGSIFADVKVLGEKNNTQSSSFAGFGTSANDIFTFFLTYDNRTNVGFSLPVDGNVSKYHDLTGQRVKGAVSWTDLEVSISDQTNASNALDGDLYGGEQYASSGSPLNSQYDRFGIGRAIRSVTTYNSINGHISRLTYWPKRLPDIELQQLTK